LLEILGHF